MSSSRPQGLKNVAVLLAGGVGARVGLDIPKQLIKIAGQAHHGAHPAALDSHPRWTRSWC